MELHPVEHRDIGLQHEYHHLRMNEESRTDYHQNQSAEQFEPFGFHSFSDGEIRKNRNNNNDYMWTDDVQASQIQCTQRGLSQFDQRRRDTRTEHDLHCLEHQDRLDYREASPPVAYRYIEEPSHLKNHVFAEPEQWNYLENRLMIGDMVHPDRPKSNQSFEEPTCVDISRPNGQLLSKKRLSTEIVFDSQFPVMDEAPRRKQRRKSEMTSFEQGRWRNDEVSLLLHIACEFAEQDVKIISDIGLYCGLNRPRRAIDKQLKRLLMYKRWVSRHVGELRSKIRGLLSSGEYSPLTPEQTRLLEYAKMMWH